MLILVIAAVVVLVGMYAMSMQLAAARHKIRLLDAKLELVLRHTDLQLTTMDLLPPTVQQAIVRGDRLGAIKLYRAHSGAGLHDAATLIDTARNEVNNQAPTKANDPT